MDDANFKPSIFGGFNKKSVVEYVSQLVNDFNLEAENLKKNHEQQILDKDEQLEQLKSAVGERDEEIKKLRDKLSEFENINGVEISDSLKTIEEQKNIISKLNEEIKFLKTGTEYVKNENKALEDEVDRAKSVAKKKVNEIIEKARLKIADEYRHNIEKSDNECKAIKDKAVKEASKILNGASSVAQKIISESRDKIKTYVDMAKKEAKEIVDSASLIGKKIVHYGADELVDGRKKVALSVLSLDKSVESVVNSQLKMDDDLFKALKNLNADSILKGDLVNLSKHNSGSSTGKNEFKKRVLQAKAKVDKTSRS